MENFIFCAVIYIKSVALMYFSYWKYILLFNFLILTELAKDKFKIGENFMRNFVWEILQTSKSLYIQTSFPQFYFHRHHFLLVYQKCFLSPFFFLTQQHSWCTILGNQSHLTIILGAGQYFSSLIVVQNVFTNRKKSFPSNKFEQLKIKCICDKWHDNDIGSC